MMRRRIVMILLLMTELLLLSSLMELHSIFVTSFQPSIRRYYYDKPHFYHHSSDELLLYKEGGRSFHRCSSSGCLTSTRIRSFNSRRRSTNNNNNLDYEYIPPRNAEEGRAIRVQQQQQQQQVLLKSSYPTGTPAGLRGEAIRSAIRTKQRCIGYNLNQDDDDDDDDDTILQCGIIQLSSPRIESLIQYLNGKFTHHFTMHKIIPTITTSVDDDNNNNNCYYYYTDAALLNGKGRIIDIVGIAIIYSPSSSVSDTKPSVTAYILTSPGHTSQSIYNILEPYIFPMDQITIQSPFHQQRNVVTFSLLSSEQQSIQDCYDLYIVPQLQSLLSNNKSRNSYHVPKQLPTSTNQCSYFTFTDNDNEQEVTVLIVPNAKLLPCAGYGYTFHIWSSSSPSSAAVASVQSQNIGQMIWKYLISEECSNGPIHVGSLEYDTLRIECGTPAFNYEMTAKLSSSSSRRKIVTRSKNDDDEDEDVSDSITTVLSVSDVKKSDATPASPLELGLDYLIDTSNDKGCYQGQEGIASIIKNPRGPPRTLYHVIFPDETNIYDYQSDGEYVSSSRRNNDGSMDHDENLTRTPKPNDTLYVLGSNEEIMVGKITSVAEPSGTGEPVTYALALIRRPDSILSNMKQMGIDMPNRLLDNMSSQNNDADGSILIPPPPLDVLDGLEVIIGGTYTIGTLHMLPSRRKPATFLFSDDDIPSFVQNLPSEQDMYDLVPLTKMNTNPDITSTTATIPNATIVPGPFSDSVDIVGIDIDDSDTDNLSDIELKRAIVEAENAAKEAQRKADKLELLRQRAEEAMARRRQKQQKDE